jgi:ACR3 family arsenite transporter
VVLATVVGVLIEVSVMLPVVKIVNASRAWYEAKPGVPGYEQCCPDTVAHPPGT